MIRLCVEKYCHDCPSFEAHVEDKIYASNVPDSFGAIRFKKEYTITCVHKEKCDAMVKYLESHKI